MGLVSPIHNTPLEVVRHHLAIQSQDFGPGKWSIGQRLTGARDAAIEAKVSQGHILRTHVMRPTWHFVARSDLRWLMALTGPRLQKQVASRYRDLGLHPKVRARAEAIFVRELSGGNHRTRRELADVLQKSLAVEGQRLYWLFANCEFESVICSGKVRGKDQTYALFDERVPIGRPFDRDKALVELVTRYLRSHGPATLKDMSWWSGLTQADLRQGLEGAGATNEEIEGLSLWSVDAPSGGPQPKKVQLLQAFDELVVGYTESRFLGDRRREHALAAFPDRSLPTGVVLLGSSLVGLWRRAIKEATVEIEVLLFGRRMKDRPLFEKAATEFGRFLDREPVLSLRSLS